MIEHFTKDTFEKALTDIVNSDPRLFAGWSYVGFVAGEHVYDVRLDWKVSIRIRSTIQRNGVSAGLSEDSIRLWLTHHQTNTQLSKLADAYTNRTPGWGERLRVKCVWLSEYRKISGDCPHCNHPLWVYRAKPDAKYPGCLFTSCFACHRMFHWFEHTPGLAEFYMREVYFEQQEQSVDTTESEPNGRSNPLPLDETALPGPDTVESVGREPLDEGWSPESLPEGSASEVSPDVGAAVAAVDMWDALDGAEEEEVEEETPTPSIPTPTREPNPEQLAAINAPLEGSVRVLAPPGSGKTFLLIRRILHLLHNNVNMGNILAVTFASRMADELYVKLVELAPELLTDPTVAQWLKRNICTIHAACLRMLRDWGDKREVCDAQWKIKAMIQEQLVKLWPEPMERPSWKEVFDWIYTAKFDGVEPSDMLPYFERHFPDHAYGVNSIRIDYENFMRNNNWLMFGDMLYDVELLLRHNPVFLKRMQTLYKYILVDEGQDTSAQAMRILTTLSAPQDNFFIVGDTDQLLYRFAGATPEINLYEGFEKRFPDGMLIKLLVNYRSTPALVQTCNELIMQNYEDAGGPYDQKYFKDVQALPSQVKNRRPLFMMCDTPEEEAREVVQDMGILIQEGYKPQDFFVAARTRAQLAYLEPWLIGAHIPFINIAGTSFWDTRHVRDMVNILKCAHSGHNTEAFNGIYNIASKNFVHPWGEQKGEYCSHHYLPRAFVQEVPDYDTCAKAVRGYRFPYKYAWKPGMYDIVELVTEVQAAMTEGPAQAMRTIADEGYLRYLLAELGLENEADGGPMDDINTVIAFAAGFKTVSSFLEYVELAREEAKKAADKDWGESAILSTIHRLKGLERKVVIGVGLSEGYKSMAGMEIPAGLLPHTFSLIEPPNLGVLPGQSQGRVEDERCIAFVLVSRAKELVMLSGPATYQGARFSPSRFIREMNLRHEEE